MKKLFTVNFTVKTHLVPDANPENSDKIFEKSGYNFFMF